MRELRQNLSVYLARVKKGERLVVTERRQVVAVLAPVNAGDDPIARLVATGRATASVRPLSALPRPMNRRSKTPLSQLVRELSDDAV